MIKSRQTWRYVNHKTGLNFENPAAYLKNKFRTNKSND